MRFVSLVANGNNFDSLLAASKEIKPLEDLLISSLTEACVSLLPIKEGKTFPPLFMNVKSVKPINVCIIC